MLYLQHSLSLNGRDAFLGRRLFDAFKEIAEECLLAHCVVDELPDPLDPRLGTDLVSMETVRRLQPNVVYLERGLFSAGGMWRIDRQLVDELIRGGCVLIAADVDTTRLNEQADLYRSALTLFKTHVAHDSNGDAAALIDDVSNAGSWHEIQCHPAKMMTDDWLKEVYSGIEKIVVGNPAQLSANFANVLATGDEGTVKVLDEYGGTLDMGVFAVVYKSGDGYAVLIGGGVSSDVWLRFAPHNTQWLVNIASFLVKTVDTERARKHHLTSKDTVFLSHRSVNRELVGEVSQALRALAIGTWLDRNEVVAGDAFVDEIKRGLATMTVFALFWSASCVNAEWVAFELEEAVALLKSRGIPILVVRLDETPVPESVSHLHRIEAEGMTSEEIARTIADAIRRRAKRAR